MQILDSVVGMVTEMPVMQLSLNELIRRVGLAEVLASSMAERLALCGSFSGFSCESTYLAPRPEQPRREDRDRDGRANPRTRRPLFRRKPEQHRPQ